ncbi:cytochrome P450 6d1-like [Topomyia yanbarensis]|uniref:cytochrome P450 6d1-like n=1 Tax=Topomyia yanbarensis TaxID=2498891 RepID=UPI00273A9D08|nr:cytochrome P450 6d1-like [Topomyia yanbarensis]
MFLLTFVFLSVIVYLGLKYVYSYWDRHGVPNLKPSIPFGNLETVAKKTESFGIAVNSLYWKSQEKLVGIYLFFTPAILIRDAHVSHQILTTDFNHFHDRGVYCNEKGDPFSAHLFALPGKRWRNLRNKFTPTFTSGQLRNMLPTILNVGHRLRKYLEPIAVKGEIVEMRNVMSRFMQEIVATVFFGYEANCINDPEDSFSTIVGHIQRDSFSVNFRSAAAFVCPALLKFTGVGSLPPEACEFVTKVITEQIEHREKNKVNRKDFIQQLIDLRQDDSKNDEIQLSLGECAANIFLFYIAGSETSTGAITFSLHELTQNPEVMQKLLNEIDETLAKSNGDINYDVVKQMKYLDLCVKETLRKYPGLPILNRECTQDYRVPNSKMVIRKGTQVVIPLRAYGMSEEYFPEPDRYSPERFEGATKNFDDKAYFPFGEGPRNCIGSRMGEMITKIGLIFLLSSFNFAATKGPKIEFSPAVVPLVPKGGISLRITRRHTVSQYSETLESHIRLSLRQRMFLYTLALFWAAVWLGLKYVYSYWDRNGLPNVKPNIPFGNLASVARKQKSFGVAVNELYWKTTGPLVGIYLFFRPAILIRDPHLAQRIITTDFGHFHDRGVYCNEKGDPFSANLFALPGKRWKDLRNKLSPTFTPGQMRSMWPTILELSKKFHKHLEPMANKREVVEMRDISSRYVLELIASVFFGIDANCIEDPEDSFRRVLRNAQQERFITNYRNAGVFLCPDLLRIARTTSLHPEVIEFVTQIITKQIEHRERNGVVRRDFIQQLIDLRREDGSLTLSLGQCAANVFLFYVAGSEPSTASIIFTLHELSHNPELMKRLQAEIDETLVNSNGEMNYEIMNEMKLLDLCVKETLRKYPGLPILNRECTEEYRVPDSSVVIKKGTQLVIPLLAFSMDEKYFPEPDRYDPERFDEAAKRYDEKAYYPFGEGPRFCIGFRWGVVVAKIGLILLLSRYNFEAVRGPKIEFSPTLVTLVPKGGIPLRISNRL